MVKNSKKMKETAKLDKFREDFGQKGQLYVF